MLDFVKKILQKVSFDPLLFEKELKKGIRNLVDPQDVLKLQRWCSQNFSTKYPTIINSSFA